MKGGMYYLILTGGAWQIKPRAPGFSEHFILPPTPELERRLLNRAQDSAEVVAGAWQSR